MTNLFEEKNSENNNSQNAVEVNSSTNTSDNNVFADQLSMITSESGEQKYATVQEALKGLSNAQSHIPKIEADNNTLREALEAANKKLEKVDSLEDIVQKLSSGEPKDDQPVVQQGVSSEELEAVVAKMLQNNKQQDAQLNNELAVSKHLVDKFGDKAQEVMASKAEEMGVTVNDLQSLARKSPKIVTAMFGAGKVSKTEVTTGSSTANFQQAPKENDFKSVMFAASSEDLRNEMAKHRNAVYERHGITQ